MITNEMLEVSLQSIQERFVKISLLQNFFIDEEGYQVRRLQKIGEVQGNLVGGSISIDINSSIRRTCSIEMVITDSSFLVDYDKKIWLDKWFRVEIGIRSLKTGEIVWFNKGVYAINNPSIQYNHSTKLIRFDGLDLMATLDGTLGGTLGYITKISNENGIVDAVKNTVWQLGKISKSQIYIEQNNSPLPYDIEKNTKDTVYSILEEIRDLYMDWEMFFSENARFIYQKIKNRYVENPNPNYDNDIVSFSFLEEHDVINDISPSYDFQNVKNKIIIWGKMLDDGTQIKYELLNESQESPFNVNGNLGIIPYVYESDKIFTQEQAEQRARYEFYKHNNLCEKVSVQSLPILFLDVNQMVEINKPEIGIEGKYLIDNISLPLSHDGLMSFTGHRIYPQGNE